MLPSVTVDTEVTDTEIVVLVAVAADTVVVDTVLAADTITDVDATMDVADATMVVDTEIVVADCLEFSAFSAAMMVVVATLAVAATNQTRGGFHNRSFFNASFLGAHHI